MEMNEQQLSLMGKFRSKFNFIRQIELRVPHNCDNSDVCLIWLSGEGVVDHIIEKIKTL